MPGWRRVRFLGQVPRTEIVHAMDRARAGLVLNHPTVNYVDAVLDEDVRVHGARASRRVLRLPAVGRHRRAGADCGIAVDPRDPQAIADAIRSLSEDPERAHRLGENGRRAIAQRYNWQAELGKLEALYRKVA